MADEPPIDLNGALLEIVVDEQSVGRVTVNGEDVSKLVSRIHIHMSPKSPPMLVLELMGFRLEAQAKLTEAKLKWKD